MEKKQDEDILKIISNNIYHGFMAIVMILLMRVNVVENWQGIVLYVILSAFFVVNVWSLKRIS